MRGPRLLAADHFHEARRHKDHARFSHPTLVPREAVRAREQRAIPPAAAADSRERSRNPKKGSRSSPRLQPETNERAESHRRVHARWPEIHWAERALAAIRARRFAPRQA